MIPQEDWVWQGHGGHPGTQPPTLFRLATRVGDVLVSTQGQWHPPCRTDGTGEPLDEETEDVFETLVFQAGARMSCGCTIHDGLPLARVTYKSAAEARRQAL